MAKFFLGQQIPVALTLTFILDMIYYSCFLLKLAHCMEENSRVSDEVKEAKISLALQPCEISHLAGEES